MQRLFAGTSGFAYTTRSDARALTALSSQHSTRQARPRRSRHPETQLILTATFAPGTLVLVPVVGTTFFSIGRLKQEGWEERAS